MQWSSLANFFSKGMATASDCRLLSWSGDVPTLPSCGISHAGLAAQHHQLPVLTWVAVLSCLVATTTCHGQVSALLCCTKFLQVTCEVMLFSRTSILRIVCDSSEITAACCQNVNMSIKRSRRHHHLNLKKKLAVTLCSARLGKKVMRMKRQ